MNYKSKMVRIVKDHKNGKHSRAHAIILIARVAEEARRETSEEIEREALEAIEAL